MAALLDEKEEKQEEATEETRSKRNYRVYTDEERQAALVVLKMNKGNYSATSRALDIPIKTIENWDKERSQVGALAKDGKEKTEAELGDKLLEIAHRLADSAPDKIEKAQLLPTMLSIGIAVDKRRLIRGEPGAIVGHLGAKELAEQARDKLYEEARRDDPALDKQTFTLILCEEKPEYKNLLLGSHSSTDLEPTLSTRGEGGST